MGAAESERALLSVLRRALDPAVGLITGAVQIPVQGGDPLLHISVVRAQNPTRISPRSKAPFMQDLPIYGTGVALDKTSAVWSALGEACERYAGCIYDPDELVTCREGELQGDVLSPADTILHSEEQYARAGFPLRKYDRAEPITWTRGHNLVTGAEAWVPATLAYMSFVARVPGDAFVMYATTGLAAGPDYASALASGICEVIERDSYMCHWLLKLTPPKIPVDRLTREAYPILGAYLDASDLELHVRDITTDIGVPCFYVAGRSPHAHGIFSGASCHPSPHAAISKALHESCHTYSWGHQLLRQHPNGFEVEKIRRFEDHIKHYLNPDIYDKTAFMFGDAETSAYADEVSGPAPPVPSPSERLKYLVARLRKRGYTPYAVDCTTADVRELGLAVAKIIVPGLHPLHAGFRMEHADTRRLVKFAEFRGLPAPTAVNDYPHPFP